MLGVSLTASTSPEEGHAGNQLIFGPSGPTPRLLFLPGLPTISGGVPQITPTMPRGASGAIFAATEADFMITYVFNACM